MSGCFTETSAGCDYVLRDPLSLERSAWFALYTRSRHEIVVKSQLDGKGIENFLPVFTRVSRWKDRKKLITLPLFPGYLFVHILLKDRLDVLKAFGSVGLVGDGQKPLAIPEDQIHRIQSFVEYGLRCDPHPYLKTGHRVRITEGPFKGIEGILARKKKRDILVVSIDLIQRAVSVEIESWKLERI